MKKRIYWGITILILLISGFFIYPLYDRAKFLNELSKKSEAYQRKVEALDKAAEQTDTPIADMRISENHNSHDSEHANNVSDQPTSVNLSENRTTPDGWPSDPPGINMMTYRYKDGIYKGMNYPEAYLAWEAKKDAISERIRIVTDKMLKNADDQINNSKAETSLVLSVFKTGTPEELAIGKQVLLEAYPDKTDEVESFFDEIKNSPTLSLEEMGKKAELILDERLANKINREQNHAEFRKLTAEEEQVYREKPIYPELP